MAFFVGMACAQTAEANQFSVISTNIQSKGDLIRIERVVQNGPNPSNRFGYYRVVRKEHVLTGARGAFILLPSLSQKFEGYELGNNADGDDYENSMVANLAEAGLDVYGYSPRATFVAPGACTDGSFDCSIMADWGINAVVDDLKFIRAAVFLHHGLNRPLIGGYSQGAMATYAALDANPLAYKGAVILEGALYLAEPTLSANYGILCDGLNAAIAGGDTYNGELAPLAHTVVSLAETDPNGPSPFFPAGTTNWMAAVLFFGGPQLPPPQGLFPPESVLAAADLDQFTFTFANVNRLFNFFSPKSQNFYIANAEIRDTTCGLAGERTYTSNLSRFKQPVLAIQASDGFGVLGDDTLDLLGSNDITRVVDEGYGHVDALASPNHEMLLEQRIINWAEAEHLID